MCYSVEGGYGYPPQRMGAIKMISSSTWTWLTILAEAPALVAIVLVLLRPRDPKGMTAWILALLFLPLVGWLLFVFFGEPRKGRHRRRRRRNIRKLAIKAGIAPATMASYVAATKGRSMHSLVKLTDVLGSPPPTRGNQVSIFYDAARTFQSIMEAIAGARRHVHLEYYIFQTDETGQAVADLLKQRARAGVECRLLLDYIGCLRMPRSFVQDMKEAGVQLEFALPMLPLRGAWRINFRNHRKIAIIDGSIGFTGSQNIGDEYSGRPVSFGACRDTHLRIVGPAVWHLQEVFAADWHYTTHQSLLQPDYLPIPEADGGHVVQVVPSGPDQEAAVMHQLLFAAVSDADESICIITPYFIPDGAMVLALTSAAYRGVRVQLMIPDCTDHRLVLWAGRSYYPELMAAGVEIYEYPHELLHSKVVVVDQTWAMVGSANMDQRSFRLNFELTTLLYSPELADHLYNDFQELRERSRQVPGRNMDSIPKPEALLFGLARLASPLL